MTAKTDADVVDAYFARQPQTVQKVVRRVRAALRKALGSADEVIT